MPSCSSRVRYSQFLKLGLLVEDCWHTFFLPVSLFFALFQWYCATKQSSPAVCTRLRTKRAPVRSFAQKLLRPRRRKKHSSGSSNAHTALCQQPQHGATSLECKRCGNIVRLAATCCRESLQPATKQFIQHFHLDLRFSQHVVLQFARIAEVGMYQHTLCAQKEIFYMRNSTQLTELNFL